MKRTKELNTNKGITLIALVITIIVMLILVGVTISMAVNGGLFEYAANAVKATNTKLQEEAQLAEGEIKVGEVIYANIDDYLNNRPKQLKTPLVSMYNWGEGVVNFPDEQKGTVLYVTTMDGRTEYYEVYIDGELKKTVSVDGTELFFIDSDEEVFPEINYGEKYIEVIGHYSDIVKCAKMTLLAEMYAETYERGYAKFPNIEEVRNAISEINTMEYDENSEKTNEGEYLFAKGGVTVSSDDIYISNFGLYFKPTGSPEVAIRAEIDGEGAGDLFEYTSIDFEPGTAIEGLFKFKNGQSIGQEPVTVTDAENIKFEDTGVTCISIDLSEYNLTGEEDVYVIAKARKYDDSTRSTMSNIGNQAVSETNDELYFGTLNFDTEISPIISYNKDNIEVVGHYSDIVKCAKMSLLAELYAEEYKEGYAKFANTEQVRDALAFITDVSYFKYVTKIEFIMNGKEFTLSFVQID